MATNEWKDQFRMNEEQIARFAGLSKPPAQKDLFECYEDGTDDDNDEE